MGIKPILFNTDMVRAILDEHKTVTRRVVKFKYPHEAGSVKIGKSVQQGAAPELISYNPSGRPTTVYTAPYQPGDVLWVHEMWAQVNESVGMGLKTKKIIYRANYSDIEAEGWKWRPSIHMPREAARIFLRVTSVRVERLHGMTEDDVRCEGFENPGDFIRLWDNTIKPADRERYGWAANPWVWVIKFERCEKPEEG